jgi:AcrR family transcriptional regulator
MSRAPVSNRVKSAPEVSTREQIVLQAIELFAERGYSNTSLDDIATRVGIKKPSLYHYIRTKEDLLYEIQALLVDDLLGEVGALLATAVTPEERVRALFRGVMRLIARRKLEMTIFINEAKPGSRRLGTISAKRDELQKVFEEVLKDGIDNGVFRELPATLTSLAALGSVTWAYRWYDPAGLPPDEVADLFVDIVLNGIAA